jgi:Fanconi anemia group M protein
MLRPDTVEPRDYQTMIAEECLDRNTLVVIPTGLGKTVIAALVIAERLALARGKALFLAPSRPLVDQHADRLRSVLNTESVACLTGTDSPRSRAGRWGSRRILAATPQVGLNDLRKGWLPHDLSVVVFDEAHRAVGDYAYVDLARELRVRYPKALFLGLTASPGHEAEHIDEVRRNLFIRNVVLRSRDDPDVAPFVQATDIDWIEVQPSEIITKVSGYLTKYLHERLNQIRKYGFLRNRKNTQVRIQDLNAAAGQVFARRHAGSGPYLFQASRQISLARMTQHALLCIEREGVDTFLKFVEPKMKAGRSKLDASFVNDERVQRAYKAARRWKGPSHPKLEPLVRVVGEQVARKPDSKIIVFAELRDTVDFLVDLFRTKGVPVERFTGQGARQGRRGMTQKQQQETLSRFGSGAFRVLVATSIAEEGLDVPQVDLVVFYEPVASDVRLIQRKGRTGRDAPGNVMILTTDKTADETYLWAGMKREKKMKRLVRKMVAASDRGELHGDHGIRGQVAVIPDDGSLEKRDPQQTLGDW